MNSFAEILSAVAASVAATLAAVNLYVAGHREHAKWARDALADIMVSFLDAGFRSKDAVQHAIRQHRMDSPSESVIDAYADEAKAAEREMRRTQTRLRLLAPPEVVDAAQILRVATKHYIALLNEDRQVMYDRDTQMRQHLWDLRQDFITRAKTALALPRPWLQLPRTRSPEVSRLPAPDDRANVL